MHAVQPQCAGAWTTTPALVLDGPLIRARDRALLEVSR
jgi:hypothetical protein